MSSPVSPDTQLFLPTLSSSAPASNISHTFLDHFVPVPTSSIFSIPTDSCSSSHPHTLQPSDPLPVNTHPMVTRSKVGTFKLMAFLVQQSVLREPTNVCDALSHKDWSTAMREEYTVLLRNNTWSLVPLRSNASIVGCKWVFKLKTKSDGSVARYKARLVASQMAGSDFSETFSPVVKPTTIRIVLTIALTKHWSIHQLDVNNAFLNGSLTEVIYMQQPSGFEQQKGDVSLVCRLHKTIYGLKQAPRAWFDKLASVLQHMGFSASKADPSLFFMFCIC